MKPAPWLAALTLAGATAYRPSNAQPDLLVIVGGAIEGKLSPCGCTKPMSGGIRRRMTAIEALRSGTSALVLEPGPFVKGGGRQDELKAETIAQTLGLEGAVAHWTPNESALGPGAALSMARLSGDRFVTASLRPTADVGIRHTVVAEGFVVGAASGRPEQVADPLGAQPVPLDEAARLVLEEARLGGLDSALMTDLDEGTATALAQRFPDLDLLLYRSTGSAALAPKVVGSTWLVSAGDLGRYLVAFKWSGGARDYRVVDLGPEHADHEHVGRFYKEYLARVDAEGLLDKVPRSPSGPFAGSKACATCHSQAFATWSDSRHAEALATLEHEDHDRDPDCVGCHVTGLDAGPGFRSRKLTPDLADVGCESCHGPAREHSVQPAQFRLAKVGAQACVPCHTAETSPGFAFEQAWPQIVHR